MGIGGAPPWVESHPAWPDFPITGPPCFPIQYRNPLRGDICTGVCPWACAGRLATGSLACGLSDIGCPPWPDHGASKSHAPESSMGAAAEDPPARAIWI